MAVIYPQATKTGRMTAVRTAIDSGGAAGVMELLSDQGAVLASVTLGYPGDATGEIVNSTLTLAGFPKTDSNTDGGVAVLARIRTSAGVDVITGLTVGAVNADVTIPNQALTQGGAVTINSAVFTHADSVTQTYPDGVNPPSDPPSTDGSLTAFAAAINLAGTPSNRWIDTNIKPNGAWAVRSMVLGARDATREEVEPGPADVGNYSAPASDTLVNSNGAAWFPDRKQFFWCGGGHGGWPGNEVYWMDVPTMTWGRINDPSPMVRVDPGWSWATTDNTPRSAHSYNGIVAVPSMDAFFLTSGAPWPEGDFNNYDIWKFHIPTKTWTKVYTDIWPNPFRGPEAHYVASEGKIAVGQPNYWRWFDPSDNTLGSLLGGSSQMTNGNSVSTPTGIYTFGGLSGLGTSCYYIAHSAISVSQPTIINATTHPRIWNHARRRDALAPWNSYFWDATREMVISWSGSYNSESTTGRVDVGRFVYAIDFDNDHLYEFVLSGGSWARSQALGSFTKWQHLTDLDCYIGLNNIASTNGWMVFKPGTMTQLT